MATVHVLPLSLHADNLHGLNILNTVDLQV